ncbi:MAG: phosphatidate cytidylyltransferase [Candidatus Omnitrophica bacterium]|nr:phosphatidate cytidylyltransferase [Candidatus Omnitrophota bacterium]
MDKLLRRTLVSILLVSFICCVIYVFPVWLFVCVVAGFIGIAQFEFFKMAGNRGIFVYKYFAVIVGSMVPVVIFAGHNVAGLKNLEPLLITCASLFVFVLHFISNDNDRDHLVSICVTLFSLLYISWFFSFFVKLRLLGNGANFVAYIVMVTKGADIGAYLGGTRFGKNELIPKISPNKTMEGTFSGILTGLILSVTFGKALTGFSFWHAAILGFTLSIVGQLGDLAESLIKRDCRVKDSGPYLADIGGILDLIDSLLFTVPIFYYYTLAF